MAPITHKQPIGVLAALSSGFDVVTHQLSLVLLPAGLDLVLWLGPRLRASALWPLVAFDIPSSLDARTQLFAQQLQDAARQMFESANWLGWLRPPVFGMPGLVTGATPAPKGFRLAEWQVGDAPAFFVWIALLAVIGIGVGGLYWSAIARQARDGRIDWGAAVGRLMSLWPRLLGLAALVVGLAFVVWLPVIVASGLMGMAFGLVGALLVMLAVSVLIWLLFYLAFSIHGIVLYNQRVLEAVRTSVWLGRTYFWPTVGILVALNAIEWGLALVWSLAPADSWLWLVSIFGNAFVVTGVSMATMVFYMDRVPIPHSTFAA